MFKNLLNKVSSTKIVVEYALGASNVAQARDEFLSNTDRRPLSTGQNHMGTPLSDLLVMRQPNFKYRGENNPPITDIDYNIKVLNGVRKLLNESGEVLSEAEEKFLRLMTTDSFIRNYLVKQVINYRTGSSREHAPQAIRRANIKLYGDPDRDICLQLISNRLAAIHPENFSNDNEKHLYTELQRHISNVVPLNYQPTTAYFTPRLMTIGKFRELIEEKFAFVLDKVPEQYQFTPQEVCDLLNEIFTMEFCMGTKFQAVLDYNGTILSVDQINRKVRIPVHRAKGDYTRDVVINTIIGHEFCVHIYRGILFEDFNVPPFYQGLANYEIFEEGLAKCVEGALSGDILEDSVIDYYINIGLAEFFQKDFRQVYEICFIMKLLGEASPDESPSEYAARRETAKKLAFNSTYRIFRGANDLPLYKDLMYFNGIMQAWQFIEENIDDPDQLFEVLFLSGKIDSANPEHVDLSNALKNGLFH